SIQMEIINNWISKLATTTSIVMILIFLASCTKQPEAERIILIGIDGMGIDGLMKATTPNIDELIYSGATSLRTRAVMPTVSGPNWGSHLLGAGPEQHGITTNGWTTQDHTVEPTLKDGDGYFPSIFQLIREQLPEAKTGFFYDWKSLDNFYNLNYIDKVVFSKGYIESFEKATPWILENNPLFSFIYIGHPDEVGHSHKWGSKEYIKAIEDVDKSLGEFFSQLKQNGMFENTHFIVVTDHGGNEYGHGGLSMDEIEIPWIIAGPGVLKDRIIEQHNDVFNTASTIAYLLGLEQPYEWVGRPVLGAFQNEKKYSSSNTNGFVTSPEISIESGLYSEYRLVEVDVNDPKVTIRFSLNGEDPTEASNEFSKPILIQKTKQLKTAAFRDGFRSQVQTLDFRLVNKARLIELNYLPSEKYNGIGAGTLTDLQIGSNDFKDGKWLGFSGENLEANLTFEEVISIQQVSLGVLNMPYSWIFPPTEMKVYAALNPDYFQEVGSLDANQINTRLENGHRDLLIKTKSIQAKYLKVIARNIGVCPPGHAGEGEKAWLFVDEIIVE
ncbi:alkaline phosphatase family protein, partial [Desulfosarcina sp.]|nr:alkaline phosphatase family protein [Desulfosarcina sp.]